MPDDISLGEAAYEAYCKQLGGVSKFTGASLPRYEDQDPDVIAGWQAAGDAAVDLYESRQWPDRLRRMY